MSSKIKYLNMRDKVPYNGLELIFRAFFFIAFFLYALAIWRFSSNIPLLDDYDAVLGFLNNFVSTSSIEEKFAALLGQHNEHRLVFNRVVQVLFLELFGEINFRYLIFFGNISWFAVIYTLWRYAKSQGLTYIEFTPVAIILLCFCTTEAMTFATPAIQFHFQILFTLLAILTMTKGFVLATMTFMFLSVFTSGGGLLTIPIVGAYYLLKTQWRNLLLSSLVSITIIFCYFFLLPYISPTGHPSLLGILHNPQSFTLFFFQMLGSYGMINKIGISSAIAFGVISFILFLTRALSFYKLCPFLFWFGGFLLMTVAATSTARSGFGSEYSLASRYSFFGILLLAVNYLAYMQILTSSISRKKLAIYGLIFSVVAFTYWYGRGVRSLDQTFIQLNQKDQIVYPNTDHALGILKKSKEIGIYKLN